MALPVSVGKHIGQTGINSDCKKASCCEEYILMINFFLTVTQHIVY